MARWHKLNPPVKWFSYFLLFMVGFSLLLAPTPQPVNWEQISFSTTASSRLYFKNVRSYYYNIFSREKPPLVLYRYKRRLRDSSFAHLQFMIVENPHADEAYIFAEANFGPEQLTASRLVFSDADTSHNSTPPLHLLNNEGHYQLAARVYNHLLDNEQIMLVNGNDTIMELWASGKLRDNALTVLEDYFTLVHKK